MDAILILGAAVWADGPSPALRRRALEGARLWHAGHAPIIIACGGLGHHAPTEAQTIAHILHDQDVPDSAVLQEDRSTTTIENLQFALPLLHQHGATSVIIVTDQTHAARARLVGHHFGLTVTSSSPSLRGANLKVFVQQAVRETFAYPGYLWRLRQMRRAVDRKN